MESSRSEIKTSEALSIVINCLLHSTYSLTIKMVSYRKQIACQNLCHKNIWHGWGAIYPLKFFLSSTLIIVRNLVAVSYRVGVSRRSQKFGVLGLCSRGIRIMHDSFETHPSTSLVAVPNSRCA